MAGLIKLRNQLLADGAITVAEVQLIRDYIHEDGKLDLQDVKFLVGLLSDANSVCPEFDDLFFPALKAAILKDGVIGCDERFYLLKMLYSDGEIRESEKVFLSELRAEMMKTSPEFDQMCETAFSAPTKNWDVGGY